MELGTHVIGPAVETSGLTKRYGRLLAQRVCNRVAMLRGGRRWRHRGLAPSASSTGDRHVSGALSGERLHSGRHRSRSITAARRITRAGRRCHTRHGVASVHVLGRCRSGDQRPVSRSRSGHLGVWTDGSVWWGFLLWSLPFFDDAISENRSIGARHSSDGNQRRRQPWDSAPALTTMV